MRCDTDDINHYIDEHGLVAQGLPHRDGGDTLHRETFIFFGICVSYRLGLSIPAMWPPPERFALLWESLMNHQGLLRRHSDESEWYGDWDRCSRDQYIPTVASLGFAQVYSILKLLFKAHLKRGLLFMTNTRRNGATKENHGEVYSRSGKVRDYSWKLPDLTGPEIWAMYIRAWRAWYLYPLLLIFDLETVIGSIKRSLDKDIDVNNHIVICTFSKMVYPTPWSLLACWINSAEDMRVKLFKYYTYPDQKPVFKLWEPIIYKVFR